jgi:hypothetical protein
MNRYVPALTGDGTTCPRCKDVTVSVLVASTPRCLRCVTCRHTWDEMFSMLPARLRLTRPLEERGEVRRTPVHEQADLEDARREPQRTASRDDAYRN